MRTYSATAILAVVVTCAASAQEPVGWDPDLIFHTFSIAAVDPSTGEVGVAVTTRVPCVGNGVPWVRAGVGAVATQASTRVEYGHELLDLIEGGMAADAALRQAVSTDNRASRRQVGVISLDGSRGQHTGDSTSAWAGQRSGRNFVTQGNLLVGPQVLDAVAASFESTEGSHRHLSDRLIEALWAGQLAGGDARKGRLQSAAMIVADSREGTSRRPDGVTANINVCENPTPVQELRRIWNTVSQTLGYRDLQQYSGNDVWQLRVILNALGHYRPELTTIPRGGENLIFTDDVVEAVDAFREANDMSTPDVGTPRGLIDAETIGRLWDALEETGRADQVRQLIRDATLIRR